MLGNVLGGGDWSDKRLVPDIVRALVGNTPIVLRSPASVRPWQHVLEPLWGYLMLAYKLTAAKCDIYRAWNFGPDKSSFLTVKELVKLACESWGI